MRLRDFILSYRGNHYATVYVNGTLDCSGDIECIARKIGSNEEYGNMLVFGWQIQDITGGIYIYCNIKEV